MTLTIIIFNLLELTIKFQIYLCETFQECFVNVPCINWFPLQKLQFEDLIRKIL